MTRKSPPTANDAMGTNRANLVLVAVCAVLALATLAVYWQVTGFGFIGYDDHDYVGRNPVVLRGLTWDGVKWAFTTTEQANWHPLTYLSLMTDVAVGDASPRFLHTTNLILHVCNVLLLFLVLKSLTGAMWRSAFVAALFAVHPLHVESVAWIVERKDCLSTFFWLLTTAAYVRYVRGPRGARFAAVLGLFALGLMAKPMLVTLPLTLLLLDYWPLGRLEPGRNRVRPLLTEKIPMFAMSALASVVTLRAQSAGGAVPSFELLPLGIRLANAPVAYIGYIGKTFWPRCLAPFYPHRGNTLPEWQVAGSLIILILITVVAVAVRKNRPYVFVGWLWYLVTLVPVIGIVQVGGQAMADRYTYVPLVGAFILVAWLPLMRGRKWLTRCTSAAAVIIIAALAVAAHTQVGYWRDGVTLWRHALACDPDSAHAHRFLGGALRSKSRAREAIAHFRKALEIEPCFADAHVSLGVCLGDMGKLNSAEAEFREALRIEPHNESALHNLAILLSRQGKHPQAVKYFEQVLSRDPKRVPDLIGLANSLLALRDAKRGIPLLKQALRIDPTSWDAANNLAWAYATYPDPEIRNPGEAVRLAQLALRQKRTDRALVLDTLAAAYAAAGDFAKAVEASKASIVTSRRNGRSDLVNDSMTRLRLYEAQTAYVQPP